MSVRQKANKSITVTPSDTVEVAVDVIGVSVDVAGVVSFGYADGTTDDVNLAAGVIHPIECKLIRATGTTATGIHAWTKK